jgi:peptidoglycan/xylan/chitin deacetylase (PgdA/CDA1 family)
VAKRLRSLAGPDPPDARMPPEDVRALVAAGCELGFHTRDHEPLPTLDDDALSQALTDGRTALEALAGRPLETVAYPHGRTDERVTAAARAAGFAAGFTIVPEAVRPETDPLLQGRLLPSFDSAGHFALQLARRLLT